MLKVKHIAGAAFVGAGVAVAPVAAIVGIGALPTKTNIPHLNNIAHGAWAAEGYHVVGFDNETPTSLGLLSMYDLKIGGGILGVNLKQVGSEAPARGTMAYDTAGLLNLYVQPQSP